MLFLDKQPSDYLTNWEFNSVPPRIFDMKVELRPVGSASIR